MRLTDSDIQFSLIMGEISISPMPDAERISGISVDLRLGSRFRTFNAHTCGVIDCANAPKDLMDQVMSPEIEVAGVFFLHPGELVLASTLETVTLPDDIVGWLDGRSSLARLGLMVHVTAHRIDPGWSGQIVLECYNAGKLPLALRPGMAIGALSFERLPTAVKHPYWSRKSAKYREQQGPMASRLGEDCGKNLPEATAES